MNYDKLTGIYIMAVGIYLIAVVAILRVMYENFVDGQWVHVALIAIAGLFATGVFAKAISIHAESDESRGESG